MTGKFIALLLLQNKPEVPGTDPHSGPFKHITAGHAGVFAIDTNSQAKFLTPDLTWQDLKQKFESISSGKEGIKFIL